MKVDKNKYYRYIIETLKTGDFTAFELSQVLYKKHVIPFAHRQFTAPRLTELCAQGVVETNGKKIDKNTKVSVNVYTLKM